MSIIRTDQWLSNSVDPIQICSKLTDYFEHTISEEVHGLLMQYGMFLSPLKDKDSWVDKLVENKIWEIVEKEEQILKKIWDGPDLPIFILPSDPDNMQLKNEFNGIGGVAFSDKLFLFVSKTNTPDEICALLTHEYNHACRFKSFPPNKNNWNLLDIIIAEGLAENAVQIRYGKDQIANWTTFYEDQELERMWTELIFPNRHASRIDPKHQDILYGLNNYPSMAGYAVGYYLIRKYLEDNKLDIKTLLDVTAESILAKI